ncbi:MAG: FAD-dependent oxidoreductase, partial [Oscillospiraceae bacterium]
MNTNYDVAVIGAGEAGIFAVYELKKLRPDLKIVVIEQGSDIFARNCPIVSGKVKDCIQCKICGTI